MKEAVFENVRDQSHEEFWLHRSRNWIKYVYRGSNTERGIDMVSLWNPVLLSRWSPVFCTSWQFFRACVFFPSYELQPTDYDCESLKVGCSPIEKGSVFWQIVNAEGHFLLPLYLEQLFRSLKYDFMLPRTFSNRKMTEAVVCYYFIFLQPIFP